MVHHSERERGQRISSPFGQPAPVMIRRARLALAARHCPLPSQRLQLGTEHRQGLPSAAASRGMGGWAGKNRASSVGMGTCASRMARSLTDTICPQNMRQQAREQQWAQEFSKPPSSMERLSMPEVRGPYPRFCEPEAKCFHVCADVAIRPAGGFSVCVSCCSACAPCSASACAAIGAAGWRGLDA